MRDFLVSLREFNCDQWTQSSLAIQLEAQQKEAERQQVPVLCGGGVTPLSTHPTPCPCPPLCFSGEPLCRSILPGAVIW